MFELGDSAKTLYDSIKQKNYSNLEVPFSFAALRGYLYDTNKDKAVHYLDLGTLHEKLSQGTIFKSLKSKP